ncbi:hypothetical protein cyc_08771 [Cyclospora cayetanensis]|uniref:Translation initiation factor beta propellor-like domain-containing protein n=1 Tax=Cyclospora cayetanensis TaxID=88456 RepID=A0A1D3DB49_9EIME|nr:hypothetical protein cyc_08771 [Cyclospora cayetanensis]
MQQVFFFALLCLAERSFFGKAALSFEVWRPPPSLERLFVYLSVAVRAFAALHACLLRIFNAFVFCIVAFSRRIACACARSCILPSWLQGGLEPPLLPAAASFRVAVGENYGGVGDCWAVSLGPPQHPQAISALQHLQRLALQQQQQQQQPQEESRLSLYCCVRRISKKVVQDVKWSPTRDEFVLIEGKSPSDIVLLDRQGRTQFVFPRRYRNFVSFCPFGQMAVIAGFGNLAGEPVQRLQFDELYHIAWKPEVPPLPPRRNERLLALAENQAFRPRGAAQQRGITARIMNGEALDESELPEELRRQREQMRRRKTAAAAAKKKETEIVELEWRRRTMMLSELLCSSS